MRQARADAGGRPWVIQPELVTGCSMKWGSGKGGLCHFCGLNAIRSGPGDYQYMSIELATRIAEQIAAFCPKARVEFAMRGEPLIHPEAVQIIGMFRQFLPTTSLMLTTNGDTLRGHMQARLPESGLRSSRDGHSGSCSSARSAGTGRSRRGESRRR